MKKRSVSRRRATKKYIKRSNKRGGYSYRKSKRHTKRRLVRR